MSVTLVVKRMTFSTQRTISSDNPRTSVVVLRNDSATDLTTCSVRFCLKQQDTFDYYRKILTRIYH